jgi:hypothetical protein
MCVALSNEHARSMAALYPCEEASCSTMLRALWQSGNSTPHSPGWTPQTAGACLVGWYVRCRGGIPQVCGRGSPRTQAPTQPPPSTGLPSTFHPPSGHLLGPSGTRGYRPYKRQPAALQGAFLPPACLICHSDAQFYHYCWSGGHYRQCRPPSVLLSSACCPNQTQMETLSRLARLSWSRAPQRSSSPLLPTGSREEPG